MKRSSDGKIEFIHESDGAFVIRVDWNPKNLSRKERDQIADELTTIARNLRDDYFECKGVMKGFSALERVRE